MLCIAGAAHAQTSPSARNSAPSDSPASEAAEVVVTAERREERAQDVPIAITVFSPERLQQQGVDGAALQDRSGTLESTRQISQSGCIA